MRTNALLDLNQAIELPNPAIQSHFHLKTAVSGVMCGKGRHPTKKGNDQDSFHGPTVASCCLEC